MKDERDQCKSDIRHVWIEAGGYCVWEGQLKNGIYLECFYIPKVGNRILQTQPKGHGFEIWKNDGYSMQLTELLEQIKKEVACGDGRKTG